MNISLHEPATERTNILSTDDGGRFAAIEIVEMDKAGSSLCIYSRQPTALRALANELLALADELQRAMEL